MASLPNLLKRKETARRSGNTQLVETLQQEIIAAQATCPHTDIIDSKAPFDLPGVKEGQLFTRCRACTKLLTLDGAPVP
jgi:hypothetical protein